MEIKWSSLPVEIRRMIVSQMFQIVYKNGWNNDDVEPPYTSLPLVCREFYHYFAHINFRVLVLDQHRLGEFERIVFANEMRQQYVERIYLRARLPWRENEAEDALEESAACRANEAAFLETVHDFMAIMSRWKKTCLSDNVDGIKIRLSNKVGGIKLHLGAIWPSPEREVAPILTTSAQELNLHSTQGFEARSLHVTTLSAAPGSQLAFAPAPIFDGFAILRNHPRCISPGFLDQIISEGMPRLKNFQYQPWDVLQIVDNQPYRDECFRVLDVLHRNKVCSLGLFYDPSISFHPHPHDTLDSSLPLDRGFYYAMLTTGLRFCCMSSFDDSTNFLTHVGDLYYPELECLVLKSRLLTGSGFHLDPPDLVKILALVIFSMKDMPKLKVLDIWKRDADHMFLVRIVPLTRKLPNRNVAIVWYSNWIADDELVEPFEKLRQISLSARWRPIFWREQNMEPAKDHAQWHRANYSGVHRRVKRVGRRLLSSLSETL